MPRKYPVGLYLGEVDDIQKAMEDTRAAGYDYLCGEVVSREHREKALKGKIDDANVPFGWFDMSLSSNDWCQSVCGVLSDVHPFTESSDALERQRATDLHVKELNYSQHLAFLSVMMNLPFGDSANLARLLNSKVCNDGIVHSSANVWINIPMVYEDEINGDSVINMSENNENEVHQANGPRHCSWSAWNVFRTAVNIDRRLSPVLTMPVDLPDYDIVKRWLGEPIKAVVLDEQNFLTNQKGFPVLPKAVQRVLLEFHDIGAHVIINCPPGKEPNDYIHHRQYIEYLYTVKANEWNEDEVLKYTKGYEDYLQSPLQPLMDNLEANTYEVFERDPVKYRLYEEAIAKALIDKVPEEEKDTKTIVAMVVGAGRGPIVRRCIDAANNAQRKVKIYAVEKNSNAVCTLLHLKNLLWGDQVTVISCDMREWEATEKADILISELLGSFGDNELSPECLDGAQKFLKDDGIMIPQNYTSFIAPVMTTKLHGDVKSYFDQNKHSLAHYETPYVVFMKNFYAIDNPKPLFTFAHPKLDVKESNDRFGSAEFTASQDCVIHGIAGYFESELYGDVLMSIHPDTHSKGMFSWFPIYFPIRIPIQVKKGDKIKINFWRCSNKHNVWYEWSLSEPVITPIANVNGRSYTIGL